MGEKRREGRRRHASEINWECCRIHQYGHLEESLGMTRQKAMRAPEHVMMRCDLDMAEYQVTERVSIFHLGF